MAAGRDALTCPGRAAIRDDAPMAARGTPALDAVRRAGVAFAVREYPHEARPRPGNAGGVGYALEPAAALGVPPERVSRTLVVAVDDRLAVAAVPSSRELDVRRLAAVLQGRRAALAG